MRRCARSGLGPAPAPGCVARWAQLFFEIFVCVVTLGEARRECFSQCNAGGEAIE